MTEEQSGASSASIQGLVRAARGRVPLDAAELLAQETPETIEAVLRALPHHLALRIALELPENLRPQGDEGDKALPVPGQVSELADPVRGVVKSGTSVQRAIDFLRESEFVDEITYLYVVDEGEKLLGLVVMRDLLLAQRSETVDDIMIARPFALAPSMEIADAIKAAVRRHYPVYPVVDADGKLIGSVRGWRLAERQAIEISAQAGRMVGVTVEQVDTPIWQAFRMRHHWLQINLVTAFLAGAVVSLFEGTITQIVVLAAFLPILAGQSGNTGCQALAISLRGLTLGNFDQVPRSKLLFKEAALGAMNGIGTGLIAALAMWFYAGSGEGSTASPVMLGLTILLAMTGACVSSGLSGVLIPVTLRKFGFDPATASSIFLTTVTDIVGMGLMLLLATTLVLWERPLGATLTAALVAVGFLTAALSGVAGIGGGTILIGVLYAVGLAPTVAVPLHAAVQFISNLSRTVAYFRHVEWRAAGWFLLTAAPTPFLVAPFVAAANVNFVLLLLAGLILTSLVPAKDGGEPLKPVPSFLLAGFLNGTLGMFVSATGLFIGRLFLRPEWPKETVIATLAMTQTLGHLLRVLGYASVGFAVSERLDLLAPLVVAVVAGTFAGKMLNQRLDEARFRALFKVILVVLSLKLIYDGVTGLMT